MYKVLFATSEVYPLVKTGGLADVSGSLPVALQSLGHEVIILLPAYPEACQRTEKLKTLTTLSLPHGEVKLLEGYLPDTKIKVWLVDCSVYFNRPGNPYLGPDGDPWHDNADRFHLFTQVAVAIALGKVTTGKTVTGKKEPNWQPDIVHCNDWQTGLIPALLHTERLPQKQKPATIFTIHNIAYQGLFPYSTFIALGLPEELWSSEALEFHDQVSFIKGGLVFADRVNTVSPNYAQEIQSPEYGYGLDGLLQHRGDRLSGILNGIDDTVWNPETDPYLKTNYDHKKLAGKKKNKAALQKEYKLPIKPNALLIGLVGRLVHQKGIDLVINSLPELTELPIQFVALGTGEPAYEHALRDIARLYPKQISVNIGYDEALAHRIEAGADVFLMPSRFEPCGLNQLYSLRYGTIPIVRRVGGLADTVVDSTPETLKDKTATGIVFDNADSESLCTAVIRAKELYQDKKTWKKIQQTGMQCESSWEHSAQQYTRLYELAIKDSQE